MRDEEDKEMIGYHYTARRLWYRIKKEGLKPYPINHHPEINAYFPDGVEGIWIWIKPHRGKIELASILWHVATKQTTNVVKLRVEYSYDDCLSYEGRRIILPHHGHFGDFVGHDGRQEGHIITVPMPTEDIELMQEYNLLDLVNNGNS